MRVNDVLTEMGGFVEHEMRGEEHVKGEFVALTTVPRPGYLER